MKSENELKQERDALWEKCKANNAKSRELTKELDDERRDISKEMRMIEDELNRRQKARKAADRRKTYMNLVLEWDNGNKFDTRKQKYGDLLDLLFKNGIPNNMETRG